ncbi:hypothetical protein NFI96_012745, partial [Prochilodus magdalenae]
AVFDHPMAGKDIGSLLCEIKQGNRSAAEYALEFRTLATGSGWSNPALHTVYKRGLRKDLRAEMACRGEALTLDQFIQTSIALDNELDEKRQTQPHYSGAHATFGEPEPMELGRMGLSVEERHRSYGQLMIAHWGLDLSPILLENWLCTLDFFMKNTYPYFTIDSPKDPNNTRFPLVRKKTSRKFPGGKEKSLSGGPHCFQNCISIPVMSTTVESPDSSQYVFIPDCYRHLWEVFFQK